MQMMIMLLRILSSKYYLFHLNIILIYFLFNNFFYRHQMTKQIEHLSKIDDVFTNDDTKKVVLKHRRQPNEKNEEEEIRDVIKINLLQ